MRSGGLSTPLIYAVDCDRRDIVRWLVEEKQADVNKQIKNDTPLIRAIFRNNELLVRDLINWGANLDHKISSLKYSMPQFAIYRDKPRLLDMMLEAGASLGCNV